ncbi:MAG TPA: response regulator transcription factor [Nitrospiraceae bacterium]|nr:response regulator transcription factor [Nitrospiraceae bacterium]
MPPITVFIADREKRRTEQCLDLLRTAKDVRVVGTARSAQEAIAGADSKPHILLFDLNMSHNNAAPALVLIRAKTPRTKVILLTGQASDAKILEAISQGARGYLGPIAIRRFLIKAVRVVHAGESWVPRAMVAKIIDCLTRLHLKKTRLAKQ